MGFIYFPIVLLLGLLIGLGGGSGAAGVFISVMVLMWVAVRGFFAWVMRD